MTDEKSYMQASSADDEPVFLRLCYETDKTKRMRPSTSHSNLVGVINGQATTQQCGFYCMKQMLLHTFKFHYCKLSMILP